MSYRGVPGATGDWVHRTWRDWKLWNGPSMRTTPRLPSSSVRLLNCSVGASMRLLPRSVDPRGVVTEVFAQPRVVTSRWRRYRPPAALPGQDASFAKGHEFLRSDHSLPVAAVL